MSDPFKQMKMADVTSHAAERITAWATVTLALLTFSTLIFSIISTQSQLHEAREESTKQLSEAREEAKMAHLVQEVNNFEQPNLAKARMVLAKKRMDVVHERLQHLDVEDAPGEMWDLLNFCTHVGLLTQRGYLDVHDVFSEFGYWFFNIYADARPVVDADRKENPSSMVECSWLIEAMRPIEAKEDAGRQDHPSEDDLYNFYNGELSAETAKLPPKNVKKQ
jgi:hypothetical protein